MTRMTRWRRWRNRRRNRRRNRSHIVEQDRINGLPNPILEYILSFMETKQVIKASLVCKKWRYLWMSVPNLHFYFSHRKIENRVQQVDSFVEFVNKVLSLRDNSYNIQRFRFFCDDCLGFNINRIKTWINAALRQHVEEIDLEIFNYRSEFYTFSTILFTPSTIRILKLKSNKLEINVPNLMSSLAANLKTLVLESVGLIECHSNGELLLDFPVLEILIMKTYKNLRLKLLNISAFRLKNLVLIMAFKELKLCTPNLTLFEIRNWSIKDFYLGSLSSLVSADITVYLNCLNKGLKEFYNATTLKLRSNYNALYQESLNPIDYRLESIPKFHNLRCLSFSNSHHRPWIQLMMNLLEHSPYLETLSLEIVQVRLALPNNEGDWVEYLSSDCTFDQLKSLYLYIIEGYEENDLKFLEIILRKAIFLKNIMIDISERDSRDHEDFREKLELLVASSSVSISYVNWMTRA